MQYPDDLVKLAEEYKDKKSTASLAKWKPPIYLKLVEYTSFLPNNATCKQRLFHVENNLSEVPKCAVCGNGVKWIQTYKPARYATYCSTKCGSIASVEKRKETNLERYGVESFSQTDEFKENIKNVDSSVWDNAIKKRKQTCLEKYGMENTNGITKEKRQKTNLERYGHTNILASDKVKHIKEQKYGKVGYTGVDEFIEKRKHTMLEKYGIEYNDGIQFEETRKQTCLERYGVESWSQHADFSNTIKQTYLEKYGVEHHMHCHIPTDVLNKTRDYGWLINQHHTNKRSVSDIANELNFDVSTLINHMRKLGIEIKYFSTSIAETELSNFLTSINVSHITNDRTILNGKELDIVIPEHKLAIEYCGLYWHSTAHTRNKQMYHITKLKQCKEQGYRLITIFEDEWIHSKELVKQKILAILGKDNRKRIYARKCEIANVDRYLKKEFFDKNHIQGDGPGSITIGLWYNELVAAMTFIKQRDGVYVLNRYATKYHIVGGFSKLLTYFRNNYEWNEIISFADRRWSEGGVYESNNFELDKILVPDYEYVDLVNIKRIHKFNFQHKNLPKILGENYDSTKSEVENTENNNWYRIFNCGLLRYKIRNKKGP